MEPRSNDRGQVTVLAALSLGMAVVFMAGIALMGAGLRDRTQAQGAADAAALAGAAEGQVSAAEVAAANGARLVRFERESGAVVVEVAIGEVNASARARARPRVIPSATGRTAPAGGGARAGLVPEMLAALSRADAMLGTSVPVASGLRSRAQQQALWDRRETNPYPVARPGTSNHELGKAVDIPRGFVPRLLTVAAAAGLCQPMSVTDPVHFEVCR